MEPTVDTEGIAAAKKKKRNLYIAMGIGGAVVIGGIALATRKKK